MEQLDKAIRQGLARQTTAPGMAHPDADLLTAFFEQTLSRPERQHVLQHLSRCLDCREVLSLSLPEIEAVPVNARQPEVSLWKRWLVVRWATAAAALIVIAGTVTLFRSTNRPHQMASIVDGPDAIANRQARQAKPAPQAEAPKTETETTRTAAAEPRRPAEPAPLMASAARQDRVGSAAKENVPVQQPAKIDATMMAKAVPPAVAPPPVNTLSSQSAMQKTPAEVVPLARSAPVQGGTLAGAGSTGAGFPAGSGRALRPSDEPALQTYNQPEGTFTVQQEGQRDRGIKFGARGTEAALMQRRESLGMFHNPPAIPNAPSLNRRWLVTNDGQLKRSHAIGDEFHTVRVADGVFFKSVAETGSEVWAGGIGGALYHSTDDGKSWMKLMPSAGNQPLIADVAGIRATQRGAAELTTSTGERWFTVDGGQHWTRQE